MDNHDTDLIVKKLLYKSKNRGCKETNLILGKFAEKFIYNMSLKELTEFAKLLEYDDLDIYNWYVGTSSPPHSLNSDIIHK